MIKKADFVERLISKFEDGYHRFRDAGIHLQLSYFPKYQSGLDEYFDREFGLTEQPKDIKNQYYEEMEAIESYLKQIKSRCNSEKEFTEKISDIITGVEDLNIKNIALNIWEFYAIPLRYKKGFVFRIHPPQSVGMPPYIESVNIELYISLVAEKTAEDAGKILIQNKKMKLYQNIFSMIGLIIILILVTYFALR